MSDINDMISRLTERQQQEFALRCARRVQHLMRDPRSVAALDTRERWLRGEATDEEMAKAKEWAWAGWVSESWSSWSAVVASGADGWAGLALASGSALAAANASGSPDAERAWQREELERMLKEAGDE